MKHYSISAARSIQNRKALEASSQYSLIKKSRYVSSSKYNICTGCHGDEH